MNYIFTDEHKGLLQAALDTAIANAPCDDLEHYFRVVNLVLENLEPVKPQGPSLVEQWVALSEAQAT